MPAHIDLHAEVPPRPAKTQWEERSEQAKIVFHKTIDGHYRHGNTGYARVACLFLTWLDDDMQCKETEVDVLREIFANSFHFETDYFEIPSEKWQTALQLKVADFIHQYDSPDCMVIIYYGGHGYIGKETRELKLSAKNQADGDGDPTVFFKDVLYCLRLPACDQLLIMDCCFAAKAFSPQEIGKRKFELLTSTGVQDKVPGPHMQGSFTQGLNEVLKKLILREPRGFSTSLLYRELFHAFPSPSDDRWLPRPHLFDQARHDLGKIWLRPQKKLDAPINPSQKVNSVHLKLSLQLNAEPDNALMNELARTLQYLPHVDKIDIKDLYAPKRQIENFFRSIVQAQKLRPLIRRLVARRRLKRLTEMNDAPMVKKPQSIQRMLLEQKHHSLYDWSNAEKHDGPVSRANGHHRHKSSTWPVASPDHTVKTKSFHNRLFSIDLAVDFPGKSLMHRIFSFDTNAHAGTAPTNNSTADQGLSPSVHTLNSTALEPASVPTSPQDIKTWRGLFFGDERKETYHVLVFMAMFFELCCFCFLMKD